jgi:uncharacterized protein (DUF2062 family)
VKSPSSPQYNFWFIYESFIMGLFVIYLCTGNVSIMLRNCLEPIKRTATRWMCQGISPRRLALTLALGFAIGCFPVVGIPTALCALLALALRLNLPTIQAANYLVMPLQLILVVPFVRLGGWLLASGPYEAAKAGALLHTSRLELLFRFGSMAGHAMLAWLVLAIPAVALMTFTLTMVLRRVPALAAAEAGD